MRMICPIIAFLALLALLIGCAGCNSGLASNITPTTRCTPSDIVLQTETPISQPLCTVGITPPEMTSSTTQPLPSPTPWLSAFLRVTREPVVDFWWSQEGTYLYYEAGDHQLWRYDPVTGETVDVTSEAPVYGQPSPFVLSRIPEDVPAHDIYFAPSGSKALFTVVTHYYEGGTPSPDIDAEWIPSGATSEIWYIEEEKPEPRWIGSLGGIAYDATWSQDELYVLVMAGHPLFPCVDSRGWLIALQEGQIREIFPIDKESPPIDICDFQIAPDGRRVFFYKCTYNRGKKECEYWFRVLEEGGAYRDEPVQIPLSGQHTWLLPNNKGLLVTDGILIYLYGLDDGTWLQLNNTRPPYTWGSVPMDPPGETTKIIKFSSDVHYIAWNGSRGLQVFSLCPGGGELLDCK